MKIAWPLRRKKVSGTWVAAAVVTGLVMRWEKEAQRPIFGMNKDAVGADYLSNTHILLPLVSWHAKELMANAFPDRPSPFQFRQASEAYFGCAVAADNLRGGGVASSTAIFFLVEALHQWKENLPRLADDPRLIDIRPMAQAFKDAIESGRVLDIEPRPAAAPAPSPQPA